MALHLLSTTNGVQLSTGLCGLVLAARPVGWPGGARPAPMPLTTSAWLLGVQERRIQVIEWPCRPGCGTGRGRGQIVDDAGVDEGTAESANEVLAESTGEAAGKAKAAGRGIPKWKTDTLDRVKAGIRKFSRPLSDLVARDANEGDTRLIVTDLLCDVLGYDKYTDLTTEYQVRGEFADYGVRVDKQLVAFVEVKRVTTKLGTKHLRQVQSYALNEGVEWVVLTNAVQWQVYHITAKMPVLTELAFEVDLLSDTPLAEKTEKLFHLSHESLKHKQIDELWLAKRASSPESLAKVLRSEKVIAEIRKELWRQTGHKLESSEVVELLERTVLRPECLGGIA